MEDNTRRRKVMLLSNSVWNLVNFRGNLMNSLAEAGYEVVTLTPDGDSSAAVAKCGGRNLAIDMEPTGVSPLRDLVLLFRYMQILRRENPDVVLGYTVKPNIYGSIAARYLGVPSINNISGLGSAHIHGGWLARTLDFLYRRSLRKSRCVFFQNQDDMRLFLERKLTSVRQARLIPGSGVDLQFFCPSDEYLNREESDGVFRFLLVARMLRDKGICEFVDAARQLGRHNAALRFELLGSVESKNPSAISAEQIQEWVDSGVVDYLGETDDVRPYLLRANCVVLPSYREGTPRALLEAAAMARPIISTDVPGCREVVENNVNGLLCRVRDSGSLVSAMQQMISLEPKRRRQMGVAGRAKVKRDFDESIVINAYMDEIRKITMK